jgi:predicted MFS family arabinose efflux permease
MMTPRLGTEPAGLRWFSTLADSLRRRAANDVRQRLEETAGGPARLRVILLLAAVLALSSADAATVGAIAGPLERSLDLSNTELGLLVTVSVGVGAVATLPAGSLADRVNRTRLLAISVLVWGLAMGASAAASSFAMLLLTRLALGVVIAAAYPATASLTGDFFPPAERGQVYGYILSGELIGTGVGFLVSGSLADALSWRVSFGWLAVPSIALAWAIYRHLPEPARSGQSQLQEGDTQIRAASEIASEEAPGDPAAGQHLIERDDEVAQQVMEQRVPPHDHLVIRQDPTTRSLWWAARYTLSIRTNVILIVASGLGYFFLQGLQTFAVVYLRGRYGLSQSAASTLLVVLGLGAIVGVLITGRLSDRLIDRGIVSARPLVSGAAFLLTAALFVPALLAGSLLLCAPMVFLAAAALGGTNPPLNAARLDIMQSRLWGRAESVRTALSTALQALAPLLFGYLSTVFGGQDNGLAASSSQTTGSAGLEGTFLVMLIPLLAAGILLVHRARRTYPADLATAIASEEAIAHSAD